MTEAQTRKKSLEERKKELKLKEKELLEKERKLNRKSMVEIGKLALKAKIGHIDPAILLGAFLDIATKATDPNQVSEWRKKLPLLRSESNDSAKQITISFKNPIDDEHRKLLKESRFRWNAFRKEFYGFGDKQAISKLFKNVECKIEVIE